RPWPAIRIANRRRLVARIAERRRRAIRIAGQWRRAIRIAGQWRRAIRIAGQWRRAIRIAGQWRRAIRIVERRRLAWWVIERPRPPGLPARDPLDELEGFSQAPKAFGIALRRIHAQLPQVCAAHPVAGERLADRKPQQLHRGPEFHPTASVAQLSVDEKTAPRQSAAPASSRLPALAGSTPAGWRTGHGTWRYAVPMSELVV